MDIEILKKEEKKITWQEIAWMAGKTVGGLLLFALLLPLMFLLYRLARIKLANSPNQKADMVYQAALYRFHIAGLEREHETPLEYAQTKVDPTLGAGFEEFMRMYLRLKYSNGSLREGDLEIINRCEKLIGPSIRRKYGFFKSLVNYFNLFRAGRFFGQGEKGEYGVVENSQR